MTLTLGPSDNADELTQARDTQIHGNMATHPHSCAHITYEFRLQDILLLLQHLVCLEADAFGRTEPPCRDLPVSFGVESRLDVGGFDVHSIVELGEEGTWDIGHAKGADAVRDTVKGAQGY